MIDRFGLLPSQAQHLIAVARLRQQARAMGIERIEVGPGGGYIQFTASPAVDAGVLVKMVQEQPAVYRLEGQEKFRFRTETHTAEERIEMVEQLLQAVAMQKAA